MFTRAVRHASGRRFGLTKAALATRVQPVVLRPAGEQLRYRARLKLVVLIRTYASSHGEESYEVFTARYVPGQVGTNERYVKFFENVTDSFELQRGLNNWWAQTKKLTLLIIALHMIWSRTQQSLSRLCALVEG